MSEQDIKFIEWIIRVKYALVAAGIYRWGNYGVIHFSIDEKSWKNLYDDGFSPIDAVLEDLKNQ